MRRLLHMGMIIESVLVFIRNQALIVRRREHLLRLNWVESYL